jgi:ABC-type molybdate transport system substrate-binding protein
MRPVPFAICILFILLTACGKDKPAPVPASIVGNWREIGVAYTEAGPIQIITADSLYYLDLYDDHRYERKSKSTVTGAGSFTISSTVSNGKTISVIVFDGQKNNQYPIDLQQDTMTIRYYSPGIVWLQRRIYIKG